MTCEITPNVRMLRKETGTSHFQRSHSAVESALAPWFRKVQFLAVASLSILFAGCNARVVLSNTSGTERGVLANGRGSGGVFTYQRFTSTTDTVDLGQQLQPSGGNDEVVAFESFRPPAITTPVTWTGGSDTVNVAFANEIFIPIRVWILKSPFATQKTRAINSCITTSGIWNSERMGLGIGSFDIVDATANPKAANYLAFDCSKQAGIEADIGKTLGFDGLPDGLPITGVAAANDGCLAAGLQSIQRMRPNRFQQPEARLAGSVRGGLDEALLDQRGQAIQD